MLGPCCLACFFVCFNLSIIMLRRSGLLYLCCVLCLFLFVPGYGLSSVIVAFPGQIGHYLKLDYVRSKTR